MIKTSILLLIVVATFSNCSNNASKKGDTEESNTSPITASASVDNSATEVSATPESKPEGPLPVFSFEKEEHDFGDVQEGEVLDYAFKFTNTGEAPLIVSSVKSSCGCTVTKKPSGPIPIGGTDEIAARFDTKGKGGTQIKKITISANTWPTSRQLTIRANVQKVDEEAQGTE